jgi:hypothetical protein
VCRGGDGDGDMALCDQCGEGVVEWQTWQAEAAEEWRKVRVVLNELADGCAGCWVTQDGDLAHLHARQSCSAVAELSWQACEEFQRLVRYERDSHSCMRCGVSQEFCATGVEVGQQCQWPGVVVPIVRAAMMGAERGGDKMMRSILQQAGYRDGFGDWSAYRSWLGRQHERRVWGKRMSNAMVVVIRIILYVGWNQ